MSDANQREWRIYLDDIISVATDDGHQWNVAPGLLRLVQSAGDVQWP